MISSYCIFLSLNKKTLFISNGNWFCFKALIDIKLPDVEIYFFNLNRQGFFLLSFITIFFNFNFYLLLKLSQKI